MANTWYVDYDNGNDTTGTGAIGLPWKTLNFATADAQSANLDTIELLYGTNGNHADQFSVSAATVNLKNLTIHGEEDAAAQVKIKPGGALWPVFGSDDDKTGVLTLDNIDLDVSTSSRYQCINNAGRKSITTTNCTYTNGAANRDVIALTSGTNTDQRVMTIDNCVMLSAGRELVIMVDGSIIWTDSVVGCPSGRELLKASGTLGNITLDGLTGAAGTPATVGRWLAITGDMVDLKVDNCIIDVIDSVTVAVIDDTITTLRNVRFKDNTITAVSGGIIITNTLYTGQIYTDNNKITLSNDTSSGLQVGVEFGTVTDWATATEYFVGNVRDNDGRVYKAHAAEASSAAGTEPGVGADWKTIWEPFKTRRAIVQYNDITMENDGAHALFIGVGPDNSVIKDNKTLGGNFGGVFKAEGLVIVGNKFEGINPFSIFSLPSCYAVGNTIISTSGTGLVLGDQDGTFTSDNYVVNNIIEQQSASVCISDDTNPTDGGDYINNNDYYRSDEGVIAVLGGANRADLAAVTAQWAIQSEVFGDINDQNSLEEDPLLDADYKPQNPNVKTGGTPDFNGDETSMGAIGATGGVGGFFVQGGTSSIYS